MRHPTPIAALLLLAISTPTSAVELLTLTTPSNVNFWVGPDNSVGGGDDVIFDPLLANDPTNLMPGPINPLGSTLSFRVTDPTSVGLGPDGLFVAFGIGTTSTATSQLVYGVNTLTSFLGTNITWNLFDPYVDGNDINNPSPGSTVPLLLNQARPNSELVPGLSHTTTFHQDNTHTSDLYTRDVGGGTGAIFHASAFGTFLERGTDPFAIFAADANIANFYAGLIPFLDANHPDWTLVGSEFGLFETVSEADPTISFNQFTASSRVFYSVDPGAALVPIPATMPLLLSAIICIVRLRTSLKN